MNTLALILTVGLGMGACGTHEPESQNNPDSSALTTESGAGIRGEESQSQSQSQSQSGNSETSDSNSGTPDAGKPLDEKPVNGGSTESPEPETPVEDDTLPILSADGKARVLALAEIGSQYSTILKINPELENKTKSVTKAFARFDKDALAFIQAMEKLPANSSKRKILLGQLKTLAAKLYDQLATLNSLLPNTPENAEAILATVASIDAFRSI